MAIKTLRVFAEYTSTGFVPMPVAGGIDYGYTLANTFPSTQPSTFQTDDPDLDVTVTAMTDFYVWIRISGTAWNPSYTRNVRVYPDSPDINSVVMNMIIATGPAGVSSYSQIVQTANRLYFNGATTDSVYNSKFAGKTYINELNFGTAPQLATVATSGAYADLTGKPALATVATSGSYADLSSKPSGTAPISYNSGTNSFQITQANSTTNGFLTSTDWNTFNNKYLLPSGGTTAQYLRGDGTLATFPTTLDSTRLILNGRNTTGTTLTKGTVVYINGVSGNTPLFARAIASADSTSAQTLGVVEFDIPNNSNGVVVLVGAVNNLDTSSYTEGVQLYLSGTVAGAFTSSKILAPTHLVYVGIVTRAHPTLGVVEVKIQNGYELDEIHDVQISSPVDKDILYRDAATSLWKHASVTSVLGYTPYNGTDATIRGLFSATTPLSYNSTTGAFSISQANGTTNGFLSSTDWTTFNSKQSALTLGNVSEVSSNVLMFPDGGTGKTIGNLTIQVVQAGATTNGYLSSTDWTTFNNKQSAITLTTTGTSGAATFSANTLNIPQYVTDLSGLVTLTTTQTISGAKTFSSALNGTSATFSSSVQAGGTLISRTANYPQIVFQETTSSTDSLIFYDNVAATKQMGFRVNSGSNVLTLTSTNVGIGTTSPTGNLEVNAPSTSTIRIKGNSTTGFDLQNDSGGGYIWNRDNTPIYFATNNTERMRITSAGNVGIGTNTPQEYTNYKTLTLDGTSGSILTLRTNGTITGIFGTNAGESYMLTEGAIPLVFYTNSAERMRITSDGSVGINGAPNPDSGDTRIQINGGQYGTLNLRSTSVNALVRAHNPNGGLYVGTTSNHFAAIFTNDTERMRITSGGNVGIGTTNPTVFGGGVEIQRSSQAALRASTTTGTLVGGAEFGYEGSDGGYIQTVQANGRFTFYMGNASVLTMRLTSGGNTLLGTSVDNGERLYVSGSIRATGNITANSDLTLKKNLKLIENPAEKLMSLNGYSYQWKENDEYQYGVIAQEVEKVMSYAVQTGNNGIKGVAYNQLTPLLIEGFKLHNSEITQLKERVKYLEAKLA